MIRSTLAALLLAGTIAAPALPTPANAEPTADFSIVKGTERDQSHAPEVVQVAVQQHEDNQQNSICTGTIIDDKWILTAAHCFEDAIKQDGSLITDPDRVGVIAKTAFGRATDGKDYPSAHFAKGIYIHPKYKDDRNGANDATARHNVALIELKEPISQGILFDRQDQDAKPQADASAHPIPKVTLAPAGEPIPAADTAASIYGFGASRWENHQDNKGYTLDPEKLFSVEVPINGACGDGAVICAERAVDRGPLASHQKDQLHGDDHRNPGSCHGDDGGPLFVTENGQRKQIGILSHSRVDEETSAFWEEDICGRTEVVYASVSYLRPWIDEIKKRVDNGSLRHGDDVPNVDLQVPRKPQAPAAPAPAPAPVPVPPVDKPEDKNPEEDKPTLHREGDPDVLVTLPKPSTQEMKWPIPAAATATSNVGSDISSGIARLRDAFANTTPKPDAEAAPHIALLASEVTMADALASGPLQQFGNLYLTRPEALEAVVAKEMKASGVTEVWLLGGEHALTKAVEADLKKAGFTTRRIAGADRTQTAMEIAKAYEARIGKKADARFVARAFGDQGDETRSWADSIALGAKAAKSGTPILLTDTNTLSPGLDAQLAKNVKATVVGGPAAVNPVVAEQIKQFTGMNPNRMAGLNRADTAGTIARSFAKPTRAIVIDGQGKHAWQLGFSLAGLSSDLNAPILLTAGEVVPPETQQVLKDLELKNVICMGEAKVCDTVSALTKR